MASTSSFDVTTSVDLQEVDNAINQAQKEIAQRYDFKGTVATIDFKRAEGTIDLTAESEYRMDALFDVLQSKLIKRGVPVKNLDIGDVKPAGGDKVTRQIKLKMALDGDTAKKAEESSGGHSGRSGSRVVTVKGRSSGSDDPPARQGFRRRAQVRELPLS
jgi:uncharacterized protein YajQ (UPF0234 family)